MSAKILLTTAACVVAFCRIFAAESPPSVTIGNAPGFPGLATTVGVSLRAPPANTTAAQLEVAYNAAKVSPIVVARGEKLTNHVVRSRQISPGVHRVLVYSKNNSSLPASNASLANITFVVSPNEHVTSGPISPQQILLGDKAANLVGPVATSSGSIFIRPVNLLPNGHAEFFLPSIPDRLYAVQATSNFVDWTTISTNLATSYFLDLIDVDAAQYPQRFYRWQLLEP